MQMPAISNLNVYRAIAGDALAKSQELEAALRLPRPGGGSVIRYDPNRGSFKHSLIAIVFAGIYLDALLHIEGVRRLGKAQYRAVEKKPYEDKLVAVGISDRDVIAACKRFRTSRNDLVHEKAIELAPSPKARFRVAQKEASHAIAFVDRVSILLLRAA